jgi:Fe/S biogenesis protein NfuA
MSRMIAVTEVAQAKIHEFIASEGDMGNMMRISAREIAPYRFEYDIHFIDAEEIGDDDVHEEVGGLVFVADRASAENLVDATIDYVEGPPGGFKFDNPRAKRTFDDPRETALHELIEDAINPKIAAHRGHITLHGIKDGVVYLEMGGSCQGCGMAAMTLRQSVEKQIRERFPDFVEIVDITNHAEGKNPFYQRAR